MQKLLFKYVTAALISVMVSSIHHLVLLGTQPQHMVAVGY